MWRNAGTKHEEPVSDHIVTSTTDIHDQDVQGQQNQEAAGSILSHRDVHEERHFSHQADGSANDERLQYWEPS